MADNENTQTQQDTQGAGQEHGQERETGQTTASTPAVTAGAQEAHTEVDVDQVSDIQALRREAAGRRRELRTVEAERDQLRGRVDASDRAEAERVAGARMADPSDLWTMEGVDLAGFRDEDGVLVPELVAQSVVEVLVKKPHWRLDRPGLDLHQGARQEVPEAPSFGAALKSGGGRR